MSTHLSHPSHPSHGKGRVGCQPAAKGCQPKAIREANLGTPRAIRLHPEVYFAKLIAEANADFLRDNAPVTEDADCLEEIQDHLEWIAINLSEGDTDTAKLQNLASAFAAATRYASVLLSRITQKDLRAHADREQSLTQAIASNTRVCPACSSRVPFLIGPTPNEVCETCYHMGATPKPSSVPSVPSVP